MRDLPARRGRRVKSSSQRESLRCLDRETVHILAVRRWTDVAEPGITQTARSLRSRGSLSRSERAHSRSPPMSRPKQIDLQLDPVGGESRLDLLKESMDRIVRLGRAVQLDRQ